MESLVTLLKLRTWRPLFRPGSLSRRIVPSRSNTCSITRSTAPRPRHSSPQHITWCRRNSGLGERNDRDLSLWYGREVHHNAKKEKKKLTKTKRLFIFAAWLIYILPFLFGACVRRVYMFSLRELGPNLSHIDFILNVNALLVNIFFCKVCCVLVVEMFPLFF